MLGLFILSLMSSRLRVGGIAPAVCISVLAVLILNEPELFTAVIDHSYTSPLLAWPWLFPIGTLVCVAGSDQRKSRRREQRLISRLLDTST